MPSLLFWVAEGVINGNREHERQTGYGKREVVGVIAAEAKTGLSPLLDLNGGCRGKQGTNIDGHVENREA